MGTRSDQSAISVISAFRAPGLLFNNETAGGWRLTVGNCWRSMAKFLFTKHKGELNTGQATGQLGNIHAYAYVPFRKRPFFGATAVSTSGYGVYVGVICISMCALANDGLGSQNVLFFFLFSVKKNKSRKM